MGATSKKPKLYYYASTAWEPKAVAQAVAIINGSGIKFDSFVVRGTSGIVFGAKLAHVMDKNLVVVRKPDDSNHGGGSVVGHTPERFIFVDDFVSTGRTRHETLTEIRSKFPKAKLVAQYLYQWDGTWTVYENDESVKSETTITKEKGK